MGNESTKPAAPAVEGRSFAQREGNSSDSVIGHLNHLLCFQNHLASDVKAVGRKCPHLMLHQSVSRSLNLLTLKNIFLLACFIDFYKLDAFKKIGRGEK